MIYSNDLYYYDFDPILKAARKHRVKAIRPIYHGNFHPMSKEYIIQRDWKSNLMQVLIENNNWQEWINVYHHQLIHIKKEIKNGQC